MKEAKEKMYLEAQENWTQYQATGLHLTHEEMADWLSSLANGDSKEQPKCHK